MATAGLIPTARDIVMKRRRLLIFAGLCCLTAAGGATGAVIARSDGSCPSLAEVGESWRDADMHVDPPTERQRLADALIRCRAFEGSDASAVESVLGRSDNYVSSDPVYRVEGLTNYSYVLGQQRSGMRVDYEHLLLRANSHRRVVSAGIVTD